MAGLKGCKTTRLFVGAFLVAAANLAGCSRKIDANASVEPAAAPIASLPSVLTSRWQIDDETSQLDHTRTVGGELASSNEVANSIGRPSHATLLIACGADKVVVGVTWPTYLGSDAVHLRWKIDDGAIVDDRWAASQDGEGALVPDQTKARAMIAAMAHAKRMVVDADTYRSGASEAVFDLDGVDRVAALATGACPAKAAPVP